MISGSFWCWKSVELLAIFWKVMCPRKENRCKERAFENILAVNFKTACYTHSASTSTALKVTSTFKKGKKDKVPM